jgi:ubiquinone/menaquinone biosynthesis C-methylase UbiE
MTSQTEGAVRERRPTILEIAEAIAPGWERRRGFIEDVSSPVRAWLVRELQPRAGTTVLELAAGVGDTGFEVASVLGPEGRLISSDLSPSMVAAARRRAADLGVTSVEFRVTGAERTGLAADAVDGVLCRFGYMLMPDAAAALAETRRVLRPDGRLALAVWGAPDRNPFFATLGRVLVEHGHLEPPDPAGPGPFSLGDPQRIEQALRRAGFQRVRVEAVGVRFPFADVDECLAVAADTAGPIGLALQALGDDERGAIAADVERILARFSTGRRYVLPGEALCAVAS